MVSGGYFAYRRGYSEGPPLVKSTFTSADAARNRQRLLDIARQQFSTKNSTVTLEDIARRAGVGIGTLYRHFPTSEALVEAVYRSELDTLLKSGDALIRHHSAFQA